MKRQPIVFRRLAASVFVVALIACASAATLATEGESRDGLPLLVNENFAEGAAGWTPTEPSGWKLIDTDAGRVFSRHVKASTYKPKHRSPFNIAVFDGALVGDFILEVKVRSTEKEYGHRDVCLVYGYQSPERFYYTHFASKMDPRAHQIFIVNDADRAKISESTTKGVQWTDGWHKLKIVRKVDDGLIEAYFDDMEKPIMTAHDKTFDWGKIGIGAFDDRAEFAEVKLWGKVVEGTEQ